jgi:hypothetical protein
LMTAHLAKAGTCQMSHTSAYSQPGLLTASHGWAREACTCRFWCVVQLLPPGSSWHCHCHALSKRMIATVVHIVPRRLMMLCGWVSCKMAMSSFGPFHDGDGDQRTVQLQIDLPLTWRQAARPMR